uniref:Uncharacterized protein n=1 Tax=Bracon brevicornis TaxID=1563983 RepID=A0A6V7J3P9_9HYME
METQIITALLLSTLSCSGNAIRAQQHYEAGIFFEKMPEVNIITHYWATTTETSLQRVYQLTEQLEQRTKQYRHICTKMTPRCLTSLSTDWGQLDYSAQAYWDEVYYLLRPIESTYSPIHTTIYASGGKIYRDRLISKMTNTNSSINLMASELEEGLKEIRIGFFALINETSPTPEGEETLINLLNKYAATRARVFESLLRTIKDAKRGFLHADTFEKLSLHQQIQTILDSGMRLPNARKDTGLESLTRIGTVQLSSNGTTLTVTLRVPLTDDSAEGRLFRMHRHPIAQSLANNETMLASIQPSGEYMFLLNYNRSYVIWSEQEVQQSCKLLETVYLCHAPTHHYFCNQYMPCELQIMRYKPRMNYKRCDVQVTQATNDFIKPLSRPGQWLYSTASHITGNVTCPGTPTKEETYRSSGIIILGPECRFTSPNLVLVNDKYTNSSALHYRLIFKLNVTRMFPKLFKHNSEAPTGVNLNTIVRSNCTYPGLEENHLLWRILGVGNLLIGLSVLAYLIAKTYMSQSPISDNSSTYAPMTENIELMTPHSQELRIRFNTTSMLNPEPHYARPSALPRPVEG